MPDWLRCALPLHTLPDPKLHRPFVRKYIVAAMHTACAEPKFATPNLAAFFRKNRSLGSKDRRRVQDAVYGLIRHEQLCRRANRWGEDHWANVWTEITEGYRFDELQSRSPTEDFATALSLPLDLAKIMTSLF